VDSPKWCVDHLGMDAQRGQVDGVPAMYVAGTGKQVGAIVFRVGQADESLRDRGSTHLIEHLALNGLDDVHYSYNGATGLTETTFFARGSADEVASFLNHVVRTLADLPWERAEAEADVLKAEAEQRAPSLTSTGLRCLLGENHAGRAGSMELALDRLDLNELDTWRRSYFTRHNAAIWFSGPPPNIPAIDLSPLPAGERRPVPPTRRLVPQCQHGVFGQYQSPAALTIAPRSFELNVGTTFLGRRLNDRLRGELGVAYGATAQTDHLSGTESIAIVATQAAHEHSLLVYEESQEELSKFVYRGGPTGDEISWYYDMFVRSAQDPDCGPAVAASAASRELFGLGYETDREIAERITSMNPLAVADAVSQARDTFCWLIPGETMLGDRRLADVGVGSGERLSKKTHHYHLTGEQQQNLDSPKRTVALVLADEGIMIDYNSRGGMPGGDDFSSLRIDELQAAYITTEGRWVLWSDQWRTMSIDPNHWTQSDRVAQRMHELIPEYLTVRERPDASTARRERMVA